MKRLAILGSTGSIGVQALDVVSRCPDRFQVVTLAAGKNVDRLEAQVRAFRPKVVGVADEEAARALRGRVPAGVEIVPGEAGAVAAAQHPDVDLVLAAISGGAGLRSTAAAIEAGKPVGLANKESMVLAGELLMARAAAKGLPILPVDSEHSAIHQSLVGHDRAFVRRLILTASGGPLRTMPAGELAAVTPARALKHPNWSMGDKITIDSATLMNKALEVIEARWLFNAMPDQIDVVIHPESVIHSLVQYVDGSVLAQLGNPDMRTPIAHALAYPERIEAGVAPLDLFEIGRLNFERPDLKRFPCLSLAFQALRAGGNAPAVLNAANEVAVQAFLEGRLAYPDIARVIAAALDEVPCVSAGTLEAVLAADSAGRAAAQHALARAGR